MPTIEVTAEQAAALARGENITIKPTRYVLAICTNTGGVFLIHNPTQRPDGTYHGRYNTLRAHGGNSPRNPELLHGHSGFNQHSGRYTFVEVEH